MYLSRGSVPCQDYLLQLSIGAPLSVVSCRKCCRRGVETCQTIPMSAPDTLQQDSVLRTLTCPVLARSDGAVLCDEAGRAAGLRAAVTNFPLDVLLETLRCALCWRAATGRCFAMKLGVQPDRVLQSMLNDRMVAKGLILQYATTFFQDYLSSESIDDLVALLRKARLDTHLLDLFPPQKRTLKDLDEHFKVGCSPSNLPAKAPSEICRPCRACRSYRVASGTPVTKTESRKREAWEGVLQALCCR